MLFLLYPQRKLTTVGKLCGASYINERFEKKLLRQLANEIYLVDRDKTLKSIVQASTTTFETYQKRIYDTSNSNEPLPIHIPYLRANSKKNFINNYLKLDW